MTCRFDHELVSMYADGALPPDRLSPVDAHISGCGECSLLLKEMRQLGIALRSLPLAPAPHGLVERIVVSVGPKIQLSTLEAVKWTLGAVLKVAIRGFSVDNELEEELRRESPSWVARWVLFV